VLQQGEALLQHRFGRRGLFGKVQRISLLGEVRRAALRRAVRGLEIGGGGKTRRGFERNAELHVDLAERGEQACLLQRRAGQALVDFAAAAIDQLARRDRLGAGFLRRCGVEQGDEIIDDALGIGRLLPGLRFGAQRAVAFAGEAPGEHDRHHQGGGDRRGGEAMTADELGDAIVQSVGRSVHGPSAQMALQVVGERCGGHVAALRLRMRRLRHDQIELGRNAVLRTRRRFARARQTFVGAGAGRFVGEHFIEQQAETVDIGRGTDRIAATLLRTRISRREPWHAGLCGAVAGITEQLGDAEIQQHRFAVRAHEYVRRLEIAMDHQTLMRELHRPADFLDQAQAVGERQIACAAEFIDRLALDVFHDEIGLAVSRAAAVEQSCDVRMAEIGEDLPLAPYALGRIACRNAAQQLDRDVTMKTVVGALGEEHGAHAAAADFLDQLVRAEAALDLARGSRARGSVAYLTRDADARAAVGVEQRLRLAAQVGVRSGRSEPRVVLVGRSFQQAFEQFLQSPPTGVAHAASLCLSQARAKRNSRSIVGTEISSTSAISSRLRPSR